MNNNKGDRVVERLLLNCDMGESFVEEYPDSPASTAYLDIINQIQKQVKKKRHTTQ